MGERAKTVLVLGRSRQALVVIRSLARAGYAVTVAAEDKHVWVAYSRHVSALWHCPRISRDERLFVGALDEYLRRQPTIPVIFPVGENQIECLQRNSRIIRDRARIVMPTPEMFERCVNKLALYQEAREAGLPIPKT